ncbi:hypothetical protein GQ42DRAFT_7297, partial [Ramicandelaber brevisporus]
MSADAAQPSGSKCLREALLRRRLVAELDDAAADDAAGSSDMPKPGGGLDTGDSAGLDADDSGVDAGNSGLETDGGAGRAGCFSLGGGCASNESHSESKSDEGECLAAMRLDDAAADEDTVVAADDGTVCRTLDAGADGLSTGMADAVNSVDDAAAGVAYASSESNRSAAADVAAAVAAGCGDAEALERDVGCIPLLADECLVLPAPEDGWLRAAELLSTSCSKSGIACA